MNQNRALAHSDNSQGRGHYLDDHLKSVAKQSAQLIPNQVYKSVAFYTGLWHDLGKYNPQWQTRLKAIAHLQNKRIGIPHAFQGALLAVKYNLPAAFCVFGHHRGLPNWSDFRQWIINPQTQKQHDFELEEAMVKAYVDFPDGLEPQYSLPPDPQSWEQFDLMTRFLFSALVDADYTDTSLHYASSSLSGQKQESMVDLLKKFDTEREKLISKEDTQVNRNRRDIYEYCVRAGKLPQGFFKLAAPTGGGKTLSLMGFALHHAIAHKQNRIIYAAPFTSILDQTADIYREIFGSQSVLEHHSAVREENSQNDHMGMMRLAAQNWDFPIIVTTTVQLLESLFSNRPSQCRKLHNIANSVIVLDEVQALPIKYLNPILSMLQALSNDYNCSIVFCTATQPAYEYITGFNYQATAMIPIDAMNRHFTQLKRVEYRNQTSRNWTWEDVIADMQERNCHQVLIVCNSIIDARNAFSVMSQFLPEEECFHLSKSMCGVHRRRVLEQVKNLLKLEQRVFLVSTQIIEAGVDLDFADGYRVIAPLDSIVQTAGRINRNGSLGRLGTLTVFKLQDGKFPDKNYENAARTSQILLDRGLDLNSPEIFQEYFKKRFRMQNNFDEEKIQDLRKQREFESVSQRFRLIEDKKTPILIAAEAKINNLLEELQIKKNLNSKDYREIQPLLVNVSDSFLKNHPQEYKELDNGLLVWHGEYNSKCGVII